MTTKIVSRCKPILDTELIVDNFAGGGGASHGITTALGRDPDLAINHDFSALEMHKLNHMRTLHLCEDLWEVDPIRACGTQPIGLAWFSPDCKHFSKAKGGRPLERRIRALAWIVVKWAKLVRPRVIMLENVEEFQDWGPLVNDRPDKKRLGETFQSWVNGLRAEGYSIEWRILSAADYGVPTTRKRLFIIARCDGAPIVWPKPTHGEGLEPYRTAAECIDWSIPTNSIFNRKRPLAENTLKRIAKGLQKFVFDDPEPFIVRTGHYRKGDPVYFRGQSIEQPLGTVCAQGNDKALVVPYGVDIAHYSKDGRFHGQDLEQPMKTIVAHRPEKAIVVPHISQYYGGRVGKSPDEPLPTVTARDHNALVAAFLTHYYGTGVGSDMKDPIRTVTAQGNKFAQVAAFLSQYNGQSVGRKPDDPAPTVMGMNKLATVQAEVNGARDNTELVRAFLIKYYGTAVGQSVKEPLHTITTKARMGVVTINGSDYQITDIGLRMFQPRELARAQGFPDEYILTGSIQNQIAKIGNSVCPKMAKVLVRANLVDEPDIP